MSMAPVPVTFLAGYLGAGKTTLLNRLLATSPSRLVVMVNDFGAINVDAALVMAHDGVSITLTNGCVCCSIADGLGEAVEQVRVLCESGARPDHVVVELSGVADPARVVLWAQLPGFVPAGVVTLADAEQVQDLATRRFVGDTVIVQLRSADLVVITKSELTADGGVTAARFVRSVVGDHAPMVDARDLDVVGLLSVGVLEHETPSTAHVHPHSSRTVDVAGLSVADLRELVARLPPSTVRAKGLVRCHDAVGPIEVEVVGRRRTLTERVDLVDRPTIDVLVVIDAG